MSRRRCSSCHRSCLPAPPPTSFAGTGRHEHIIVAFIDCIPYSLAACFQGLNIRLCIAASLKSKPLFNRHDVQLGLAALSVLVPLRFSHHRNRFAVDLRRGLLHIAPRFRRICMGCLYRWHAVLPPLAEGLRPARASAAPLHAATGMRVIRHRTRWHSAQPLDGGQERAVMELAQHRRLRDHGCHWLANCGMLRARARALHQNEA
jgi:hypothetical protein